MNEQFNTWSILLHNDRKGQHWRIKKKYYNIRSWLGCYKLVMRVLTFLTHLAPNCEGLKNHRPCFLQIIFILEFRIKVSFCSIWDFCSHWGHLWTFSLTFNRYVALVKLLTWQCLPRGSTRVARALEPKYGLGQSLSNGISKIMLK